MIVRSSFSKLVSGNVLKKYKELGVRGEGNVEALLRCSCVKVEKRFSTRGACAAIVNGDMASCVPAPACDGGSCAFEIVEK